MEDRFDIIPDPAVAGEDITIQFTNGDLASTTVEVTVNNGGSTTDKVDIQLDENGYGTANWTVPSSGWPGVIATHPTSADHGVQVVQREEESSE